MVLHDDSTEQTVIHKSELINVPIFVISVVFSRVGRLNV